MGGKKTVGRTRAPIELALLLPPLLMALTSFTPLLLVIMIPVLMLLPAMLLSDRGAPPDGGEDGPGGGGSAPPDPPPVAPQGPIGDLPLPHSLPGRWRLRESRRAPTRRIARRPPHEPSRPPAPVRPSR